ncbi:hypothetical protein GCM10011505_50950 [Tistrella bauzanensis]|uniref:Alpha/beta hydrolase n=1 Tax=Tistrella bauzanensis TaxID=657419 RepID=A0ABQ1JB94_9PROT|nr:hypothetical protein GCM10011505_50950 [Tistrella bauzanensis]
MAISTPAVPLGPRAPTRCRSWHMTCGDTDSGAAAARAAAPAGHPVIMLPGSGACLDSYQIS